MNLEVIILGFFFIVTSALRLPVEVESDLEEIVNVELINKLQYEDTETIFLPDWMKMRFQFSGKTIVMNLQRRWDILQNFPVFVTRNDDVVPQDMPLSLDDAVYENAGFKGSFIVSIHTSDYKDPVYTVFGTFVLGDFEEYAIQPVENFQDSNQLHLVVKPKWGRTNSGGFAMTLNQIPKTMPLPKANRKKRNAESKMEESLIELLFVVDYSIYKIWYEKSEGLSSEEKDASTKHSLKQFYLYVISGIDMRFKEIPEQEAVKFGAQLIGLYIADTPNASKWTKRINRKPSIRLDADKSLESFRGWSASRRGLPPHDHAMAFTAYDLIDEESEVTAGISYLASMCSTSSHSLVEDSFNFKVSMTATHEIAHSLGADHDGSNNRCRKEIGYIMDTVLYPQSLTSRKNNWKFSSCSVKAFIAEMYLLNTYGVNCLSTLEDSVYDIESNMEDAGYETRLFENYEVTEEVDQMCIDTIGNGSALCREKFLGRYYMICFKLFCTDVRSDMGEWGAEELRCISVLMKEHIPCGNKKWCLDNHECDTDDTAPDVPEHCPFGDMPGKIYFLSVNFTEEQVTCNTLIEKQPFICYFTFIERRCCASCAKKHTGIVDCEYGDVGDGICKADACDKYWPTTNLKTCCSTCDAEDLTPPPTTTPRPGCYGNTPDAQFGPLKLSCEKGVKMMPHYCYDSKEFEKCCQSCEILAAKVEPQIRALRDCSFGDHDVLCWPTDCPTYDDNMKKKCCFSCSAHQNIMKKVAEFAKVCNEPTGKIPALGGSRCSDFAPKYSTYCYYSDIGEICCKTCSSYGDPDAFDCPYGDRSKTCSASSCEKDISTRKNTCCKTCAVSATSTAVPTFAKTEPTTTRQVSTWLIIEDSAEGLCFKNIQDLLLTVVFSLVACLTVVFTNVQLLY